MQENTLETPTHTISKKAGDSSITGSITSKELFYKQKSKKLVIQWNTVTPRMWITYLYYLSLAESRQVF